MGKIMPSQARRLSAYGYEIENVMVAYRVKEDSAVPLALPGQVILCGDKLKPSDLDAFIGGLVAVTTTDGANIFKRVGEKLPSGLGALRQFETIGGLGSSVVIATEEFEGMPPVPTMVCARKVIAVLYDGV